MDGSSEYQSLVIYHHNSPSWAETVRLAIPIDKFYGSHVRFEFRHCSSEFIALNRYRSDADLPPQLKRFSFIFHLSTYFLRSSFTFSKRNFPYIAAREKNDKKFFAFAFVRLMEPGGATLQDGPHELYIYKCEERTKLDSLSYLSLPSSTREPCASGKLNFLIK